MRNSLAFFETHIGVELSTTDADVRSAGQGGQGPHRTHAADMRLADLVAFGLLANSPDKLLSHVAQGVLVILDSEGAFFDAHKASIADTAPQHHRSIGGCLKSRSAPWYLRKGS